MDITEREQWIELAGMLGYQSVAGLIRVPGGLIRAEEDPECQAMLHGLACHEANGAICRIFNGGDKDKWAFMIGDERMLEGTADTRPAAAIAMLKLFREMPGVGR